MVDFASILNVLQHGDSFFPSGSVSFSWGLEAMAGSGSLATSDDVQAFIIGMVRSPLGITLMAVRDNETKSLMMGVNPLGPKTLAFVLASAIAGLAGSLYVHYLQYANPEFFTFAVSIDLFLAVILGGVGTLWGPAFGVIVLEVIREVLRETVALRLLLFGVLLVVLIVCLPQGLLPPLGRLARRLLPARAAASRR